MTSHPAWLLIVAGVVIAGIGLLWLFGASIPWLGRLPGDLVIERENFRISIPITTSIVLSIFLSAILWLVRFFSR